MVRVRTTSPRLRRRRARRTDGTLSAFGSGQISTAGQRALPCGLTRRIDVKDEIAAAQATRRCRQWFPRSTPPRTSAARASARKASKQGRSTSERRATQTGARGKTSASKQSHEGRFERRYALKEVRERPFPADGVAYQQGQKVNRFIAAEATSYQADPARAKASSSPFVAR